jgi:hypothetical protein
MIALQHRIRDLLLCHEWFSAPVTILCEDKDGIEYLISRKTQALMAPLVVVRTASGDANRRPQGVCDLTESVGVYIVVTPSTDTSARVQMEGVDAAIRTLHEAPVVPGEDEPDSLTMRVSGHSDASERSGEVIHCVQVEAPWPMTPIPVEEDFFTRDDLEAAIAAERASINLQLTHSAASASASASALSATVAPESPTANH